MGCSWDDWGRVYSRRAFGAPPVDPATWVNRVAWRHAVSRLRQARLSAVGTRVRRHASAGARRRRRQAGLQADRLPAGHADAAPRHRRRRELRRHRLDVPRGHLRDVARGGAQGRVSRAREAGHQDAGLERREAGRLRPHPRHPARAPAGRPHRLLPLPLAGRRPLAHGPRAGPARRRRARARRRAHRPPGLQLPRHLRGLRADPRRHRPVGVLPDPVQLHGRGRIRPAAGGSSWRPARASA